MGRRPISLTPYPASGRAQVSRDPPPVSPEEKEEEEEEEEQEEEEVEEAEEEEAEEGGRVICLNVARWTPEEMQKKLAALNDSIEKDHELAYHFTSEETMALILDGSQDLSCS